MIKSLLIISAILFSICASAQADNVYLFPDYIIYKGDSLSRYDKNGLKQGDWIEIEVINNILVPVSDTCDIDNRIQDGIDFIYATQYYSRKKNSLNSNCDSVFSNIIPSQVIQFLSFGRYDYNLKDGIWRTYNNNSGLYRVLHYDKGKQFGDFQYYYPNDSIMISGYIDTLNQIVSFKRYSNDGSLIEDKTTDIELLYRVLR